MKERGEAEMATDPMSQHVISHPFLHGLNQKHLTLLTDCALPVRFKAGEIIFREGGPANRFYLITRGKVVLESATDDGEPIVIETIGGGDFLGWSWMMPPYQWRFTARAVEPTEAVFFVSQILRQYCERDHSLGFELHQRMSAVMMKRLQAARQKLLSLKARASRLEAIVLESPFMDQELDAGYYTEPVEAEALKAAEKPAPAK
jgi:CRP/FNR family cyclic AMP-dependent transcriptional regulator